MSIGQTDDIISRITADTSDYEAAGRRVAGTNARMATDADSTAKKMDSAFARAGAFDRINAKATSAARSFGDLAKGGDAAGFALSNLAGDSLDLAEAMAKSGTASSKAVTAFLGIAGPLAAGAAAGFALGSALSPLIGKMMGWDEINRRAVGTLRDLNKEIAAMGGGALIRFVDPREADKFKPEELPAWLSKPQGAIGARASRAGGSRAGAEDTGPTGPSDADRAMLEAALRPPQEFGLGGAGTTETEMLAANTMARDENNAAIERMLALSPQQAEAAALYIGSLEAQNAAAARAAEQQRLVASAYTMAAKAAMQGALASVFTAALLGKGIGSAIKSFGEFALTQAAMQMAIGATASFFGGPTGPSEAAKAFAAAKVWFAAGAVASAFGAAVSGGGGGGGGAVGGGLGAGGGGGEGGGGGDGRTVNVTIVAAPGTAHDAARQTVKMLRAAADDEGHTVQEFIDRGGN